MADEERPPAPPMRSTSHKDSPASSKPLPSTPNEGEKKKKKTAFTFFPSKGDDDKKCAYFCRGLICVLVRSWGCIISKYYCSMPLCIIMIEIDEELFPTVQITRKSQKYHTRPSLSIQFM